MSSLYSPQGTARSRVPRIAGAAVERARLSVVPVARTRAARVPFVSLVTVLLLGGVVGLLLFNTSMQQSAFAATSLEQRATVLSARQEALATKLERLRDPQEIARKAQRMGMQVPAAPLFLDLSDGSVSGDASGATLGARVALDPLPPARPSELDPPATVVTPPEGVLADPRGGGSGGGDGSRNEQDEKKQTKAEKKAEKKAERKAEKAEKKAERKAKKNESDRG
ncbi:hypothetical protein NOK12_07020 [Nocardioides sp. OK12]|uniref:hypothetical protein n=1 Tax=Nocardioides sp. OK12 TaxID=2758661 RepID=UPI0021C3EBE2|nr:hypothetical protein [Nocardioides sp. OK12]GHJ58183.1 hypothetical protein NOK12_07020 [Nocardioides sp. OK12]